MGMAIKASVAFLEGRRVLYAGPTGDQLGAFWTAVKQIFAEPIAAGVYHAHEGAKVIERRIHTRQRWFRLSTKNRIRAKTAWDADTLRGRLCGRAPAR